MPDKKPEVREPPKEREAAKRWTKESQRDLALYAWCVTRVQERRSR